MKEYKTYPFSVHSVKHDERLLNEFGEIGWVVISVQKSIGKGNYLIFLEREIPRTDPRNKV